ncbi:MAG TPA: hypothetical protein DD656_05445 [Alphaproteobacteria bacterium]|nr:hypothetical protein [Alphaproteobacteria bacterium]
MFVSSALAGIWAKVYLRFIINLMKVARYFDTNPYMASLDHKWAFAAAPHGFVCYGHQHTI